MNITIIIRNCISTKNPHFCRCSVQGHPSKTWVFHGGGTRRSLSPTTLYRRGSDAWVKSKGTTKSLDFLPPPKAPLPPLSPLLLSNTQSLKNSSPAKTWPPPPWVVLLLPVEGGFKWAILESVEMRMVLLSQWALRIWILHCRWSRKYPRKLRKKRKSIVFGKGGLVGLHWKVCSFNRFINQGIVFFNPQAFDHKIFELVIQGWERWKLFFYYFYFFLGVGGEF